MRSRFCHTIISLLLVLFVGLGASLAGGPACPPDCPDCRVVPTCCSAIDAGSVSGVQNGAGHLPGPSDCSHDGICLDGFQPIDVSAASGTFGYTLALVLSSFTFEAHSALFFKAAVPAPQQSPLENFPPHFLRNCSFLI